MKKDETIVSISNKTDIRQGWRVRVFVMPAADWNALGRTLVETRFRTEAEARTFANRMATQHNAKVQG